MKVENDKNTMPDQSNFSFGICINQKSENFSEFKLKLNFR